MKPVRYWAKARQPLQPFQAACSPSEAPDPLAVRPLKALALATARLPLCPDIMGRVLAEKAKFLSSFERVELLEQNGGSVRWRERAEKACVGLRGSLVLSTRWGWRGFGLERHKEHFLVQLNSSEREFSELDFSLSKTYSIQTHDTLE